MCSVWNNRAIKLSCYPPPEAEQVACLFKLLLSAPLTAFLIFILQNAKRHRAGLLSCRESTLYPRGSWFGFLQNYRMERGNYFLQGDAEW